MTDKLQEWIEAVEWAAGVYEESKPQTTTDRLTELAAYLRDGGWLPIESAPKDGTWLLLRAAGPDSGYVVAAWDADWSDDGWWMCDDGKCAVELPLRGANPTYYRPLPAPPAALAMPGGEE